ncbi:MAG: hypothetical protein ABL951_02690 [Alphaproteobacteria bacterium]
MTEILHTKDFLALELLKAGLPEMAAKAATGYYHDFLSPLSMPDIQLANDLDAAGTPAALTLRKRHFRGEFDASKEESDTWAASEDGRKALIALWRGVRE